MARTFTHVPSGRSVVVLEGSTLERLVVADGNWTEDKPVDKTEDKAKDKPKEASRGASSSGRRRSPSRSSTDRDGDGKG